jgi:hypothetical protein
MKMIKHFAMAILLSLASTTAEGQITHQPQKAIDYRLVEFEVNNATFVEAVSELSEQPVEGLHIGIEEVLRKTESKSTPEKGRFSLKLKGKTVREVLDALCGQDGRYMWTLEEKTINIYPKAIKNSSSYLLNRKLDQITVTDIHNPEAALVFLDRQLPPPREQLGYGGTGGDSSYDIPWSQSFRELTVRQFINRLSEHMGSRTSWVFFGSVQERLFTFRKGGFQ